MNLMEWEVGIPGKANVRAQFALFEDEERVFL